VVSIAVGIILFEAGLGLNFSGKPPFLVHSSSDWPFPARQES
jgi:hypothetical protein